MFGAEVSQMFALVLKCQWTLRQHFGTDAEMPRTVWR